jgi:hypothetical protein
MMYWGTASSHHLDERRELFEHAWCAELDRTEVPQPPVDD